MTHDLPDDLREAMPAAPDAQQSEALAEASSWVGHGVEGVGLGETPEGAPCVVVYTSGGHADVPDEVAGLPVRVEESGPFLALDNAQSALLTDDEPGD